MPYAEPTSPVPAPLAKSSRSAARRHSAGSASAGDVSQYRASSTSPMPTMPRRATASSGSSTPRKTSSPLPTRNGGGSAAVRGVFNAMQALPSLTNRIVSSPTNRIVSSPVNVAGGLGLQIHGRNAGDSLSSDSSAAPSTPEARIYSLPSVPKTRANAPAQSAGVYSPPQPSLLQRQKARGLSATSLPSPTMSNSSPLRPSNHMIRKKSGEVVKSSLKQRSMSTPDLGRTSGEAKGPTSVSSRDLQEHKSVRFNDLGLESVVLFLREQKPTAVSKTADTNEIPTETEDDNDTDLSDYVHFRTRRGGAARASDEGRGIQIDQSSSIPRVRVDFGPGTHDLLKDEHVVLERVDMQNGHPLVMRGTVLVRNAAFQKWVAVRFTLDQWQTVSEVSGLHVCHIPAGTTGDEGWDRFSFTIKLDDYKRKLEERAMLLCVRFSVDGREWWDSNRGDNYRFTFRKTVSRKPRPVAANLFRSSNSEVVSLPPLRPPRATKEAGAKSPRNWTFPRTGAQAAPPRTDSPALSPPPAVAFRPPAPPDVHSHLQLKKWCSPSPPQSPPKKFPAVQLAPLVLPLVPERTTAAQPVRPPMMIVHGHPATSWSPHDRSLSWNGKPTETWGSTDTGSVSDDSMTAGEITPTAARARSPDTRLPPHDVTTSPESGTPMGSSEDEGAPIHANRSIGDLRALVSDNADAGLMTPPSSNLSSPPTPSTALPGPLSPTASLSTGDSSPAVTITESPSEDTAFGQQRGRTLNSASYQEFLDKFCFFKSPPPVTAPLESPYKRAQYSGSGYSSPAHSGFGFYGGHDTPTPVSAETTEFPFNAGVSAAGLTPTSASGSTPRASPPASAPPGYQLPWTPGSENMPSSLAGAA